MKYIMISQTLLLQVNSLPFRVNQQCYDQRNNEHEYSAQSGEPDHQSMFWRRKQTIIKLLIRVYVGRCYT